MHTVQTRISDFDAQRHLNNTAYITYVESARVAYTRKVIGACGIVSKVGGFQPFYAYRIETSLFESKVINVRKEVPVLRLVEEHDGPCEIGSLFLHPDWRHDRNGKLLNAVDPDEPRHIGIDEREHDAGSHAVGT